MPIVKLTVLIASNLFFCARMKEKGQSVDVLQSMEKSSRDKIIRQIKNIEGATQRQIARVAGINQSLVFKA